MFHQLSLQVGVKHNSLNQNNINQNKQELSSKNELTIGRTDKCTLIEISAFKVIWLKQYEIKLTLFKKNIDHFV